MANRTLVAVRIGNEALASIDRFAAMSGSTRSGLIRFLVEDFAKVVDELGELIASARRGSEAEAVGDWVQAIVSRVNDQADQLVLPTSARPERGSSAA